MLRPKSLRFPMPLAMLRRLRSSPAAVLIALLCSLGPVILLSVPSTLNALLRNRGLHPILSVLPWIFFGVTAFLGAKMNQARILFLSLLLLAIHVLLLDSRSLGLPASLRNEAL